MHAWNVQKLAHEMAFQQNKNMPVTLKAPE